MVATSERKISPRMAGIAARREATNAERSSTFTVARDAYLEGKPELAEQVIAASRKGLTRTQYKQIARMLADAKRDAEALALLTKVMGEHSAKEELEPLPTAKLGDILVASWGYDQTNIDYYQVVALVGTTKVRLRKIAARNTGNGGEYQNELMPVRDSFLDTSHDGSRARKAGDAGMLHAIQKASAWGKVEQGPNTDRVRYCVRIASYAHAYLWDGMADRETAAGYGH
jgi:hypothetical protein